MPVTIAQFSDIHLAARPSNLVGSPSPDWCLERSIDAVLSSLDGSSLDLVVVTGDIADDGSVGGCERVRASLTRLGAPVVAAPGNHDRRAAVVDVFGDVEVDIDLGSWRVVVVDTVVVGEDAGRIDVDALAARLDAGGDRPTLVALHHPIVTTSTNQMFQLDGARAALALFAQRPAVRGVLSGHLHEPFNIHVAGTAHLGAPSTWYALEHSGDAYNVSQAVVGATLLHLRDDATLGWQRIGRVGESVRDFV